MLQLIYNTYKERVSSEGMQKMYILANKMAIIIFSVNYHCISCVHVYKIHPNTTTCIHGLL